MKKSVIAILIIIGLFVLAIPLYLRLRTVNGHEDDGIDVVQAGSIMKEYKGTIVYARQGLAKGIYSISLKGEKKQCISVTKIETIASRGGTIAFTDSDISKLNCIFLYSDKPMQSFKLEHTIMEKAAINPDGSLAVCISKKDEKGKELCELYSVSVCDGKTTSLQISETSITDVSFIKNDSIIYSELVKAGEEYIYQLYVYSFKTKEKTPLYTSANNDINPVVSPDGRYVAFISLINSCYNPCIMELSPTADEVAKVINSDVVLGGTLKWSPDSRYLLYTAVDYSSKEVYSIKVVDTTDSCKNKEIGYGYIGSFSPDSTAIVIAAYDQQKDSQMQVFSIADIGGGNIRELMSLTEYGRYAKSIRMLEWIN